jgi:hypothetical protein
MLVTPKFEMVEVKNMWIFIPCFNLLSEEDIEAIRVELVIKILNGKAYNIIGGEGLSTVEFQLQSITKDTAFVLSSYIQYNSVNNATISITPSLPFWHN